MSAAGRERQNHQQHRDQSQVRPHYVSIRHRTNRCHARAPASFPKYSPRAGNLDSRSALTAAHVSG
jgi:hypothetical protein